MNTGTIGFTPWHLALEFGLEKGRWKIPFSCYGSLTALSIPVDMDYR